MRYLHTMVRVQDLEASITFWQRIGLIETRRKEHQQGRFTLVFLATAPSEPEIELTWNWDNTDRYADGNNFGHVAYEVEDIYQTCQTLQDAGVTILRPPRDGHMAFVRSPDNISVELLQTGDAKATAEPWASMANTGTW